MKPLTRHQLYWLLQLSGWTLYALLGAGIYLMIGEFHPGMLALSFTSGGMMLGSTHLLRLWIRSDLADWKRRLGFLAVKIVLFLLLSSFVINVINSVLLIELLGAFTWGEFSIPYLLLYMLQTCIYFILWLGAYATIRYLRNYRLQEVEKWRLESAVKEAELIALKAQVNPHFLFNALNNIKSLVLEDPHKSREMITHLADLLRYSIAYNHRERVTLKEELDMVTNYLALESIHYENRLRSHIEWNPQWADVEIPPMVIQLMVENAVKHGISQCPGGGDIDITINRETGGALCIRVSNTGQLKVNPATGGIGLRNARERIRLITGAEPGFSLHQQGERVECCLTLVAE